MMGDYRTDVRITDMPEEMQKEVLRIAIEAAIKFTAEKDIASFIKKDFDKKFGRNWHCVVGLNFGSFVTHERNRFISFYLDGMAIELFKTPIK